MLHLHSMYPGDVLHHPTGLTVLYRCLWSHVLQSSLEKDQDFPYSTWPFLYMNLLHVW